MDETSHDDGFTLIEALVTISLLSIMMLIAVSGWSAWSTATAHRGTAEELQVVLRQVQQRAVTEGREFRVRFNPGDDTYTVLRITRDEHGIESEQSVLGPVGTASDQVEFERPQSDDGPLDYLAFRARGSASPGAIKVARSGADPYVVTVEGLTGRVSIE